MPESQTVPPLSIRLLKDDMRKLTVLGERLEIGPSSMARLTIEKFIKQHDPDR